MAHLSIRVCQLLSQVSDLIVLGFQLGLQSLNLHKANSSTATFKNHLHLNDLKLSWGNNKHV
jgi:hypothetical protein